MVQNFFLFFRSWLIQEKYSGKSVAVCFLANFYLDCFYLGSGITVLPKVTLSEVASLLSQNPTQLSTTIRAQGRYTFNIILCQHRGRLNSEIPGSESNQCVFVTETQLEELRKFQLKVKKVFEINPSKEFSQKTWLWAGIIQLSVESLL